MLKVLVSDFEADLGDPAHMYGVKEHREMFIGAPYNISLTLCTETETLVEIVRTLGPRTHRRPGDNFKLDLSLFMRILPSGEEVFDDKKWREESALVFREAELEEDVCEKLSDLLREMENVENKKADVVQNILKIKYFILPCQTGALHNKNTPPVQNPPSSDKRECCPKF